MPKAPTRNRIKHHKKKANPLDTSGRPVVPSNPVKHNDPLLVTKLRAEKDSERLEAATALSSMFTDISDAQLRPLLAKNAIGVLIERLGSAETNAEVRVAALGALRNLAVNAAADVVSEIHNKKILLPLFGTHIPELSDQLDGVLHPTTTQDSRLFWTWADHVVHLLWVFTESNSKILKSLNKYAKELVTFLFSFLSPDALGLTTASTPAKRVFVRSNVALAASQTLRSLFTSNESVNEYVTRAHVDGLVQLLATTAPPVPGSARKTIAATVHPDTVPMESGEWKMLRIVGLGILVELAYENADVKALLEQQHIKDVLYDVLSAADVPKILQDSSNALKANTDTTPLVLYESDAKLDLVNLALEILAEWCAVLGQKDDDEGWAGVLKGSDDVDMDDEDDSKEVIFSKRRDDQEMDVDRPAPDAEVAPSIAELVSLPSMLIPLILTNVLSYVDTKAVMSTLVASDIANASTNYDHALFGNYEPTSKTEQITHSHDAQAFAEQVTTVHVRALEVLNNALITLLGALIPKYGEEASADGDDIDDEDEDEEVIREEIDDPIVIALKGSLQPLWDGVLNNLAVCMTAQGGLQELKSESLGAALGSLWGLLRLSRVVRGGLAPSEQVYPDLLLLYSHPFASEVSSWGESIKVKLAGILGLLGRRSGVSIAENEKIGSFLVSLLPQGKPNQSNSTKGETATEALSQIVDSVIDIYSDETADYDAPVFVKNNFLEKLERAIPGVRAASKKVDAKNFPALRTRIDGAVDNLSAFVEYRQDL